MFGDPLAKPEIDAVRVVQEKAQRVRCGLLQRDQLDPRIELGEAAFNGLLNVLHRVISPIRAEKRVGQAHSSTRVYDVEQLETSIARRPCLAKRVEGLLRPPASA